MSSSGTSAGVGRLKGSEVLGFEPALQLRVPKSSLLDIKAFLHHQYTRLLPLYSSKVQAGFPSPADDYIERYLDLNAEYIKHPSATFLVTATGDSMMDVGIYTGDVLVVDRSLEATDGKIVIAAVNGELTVKRLSQKNGRVQLLSANAKYKPIDITDEHEVVIWGVVILVLHVPV